MSFFCLCNLYPPNNWCVASLWQASPTTLFIPLHYIISAVWTVDILLLFLCIWITYSSLPLTGKLYECGSEFCFYLSSLACSKCLENTRSERAIPSLRGSVIPICVLSHMKTQLVKARNCLFPVGTFSSPLSYTWGWCAWLTQNKDKKGTIPIHLTDIFPAILWHFWRASHSFLWIG